MKLNFVCLLLLLIVINGCKNQSDNAPPVLVSTTTPTLAVKPDVTLADWKAALTSAYAESNRADEGDSVTTFTACFDDAPTPGKCAALMFAKRDAFRKVTHFTPDASTFQRFESENYVFSYLALSDCKMPVIFFVPRYSSKNGWLFSKKVAVLVDGEVALERDFSELQTDVKRNVFPNNRVEEEVHLVATESDRASFKKIIDAKEVSVRITGEKGYVNLKPRQLSGLREDAASMQFIYDKLDRVLKNKIPAACN